MAIVVSLVALVAPIASATAAWFSWRTARSSEEIARSSLQTSGMNIGVRRGIFVTGGCEDRQQPLAARVTIFNIGRIAGRVLEVGMDFRSPTADEYGPELEPTFVGVLAKQVSQITVPAQDSVDVTLKINCPVLTGTDAAPSKYHYNPTALLDDAVARGYLSIYFMNALNERGSTAVVENIYYR